MCEKGWFWLRYKCTTCDPIRTARLRSMLLISMLLLPKYLFERKVSMRNFGLELFDQWQLIRKLCIGPWCHDITMGDKDLRTGIIYNGT